MSQCRKNVAVLLSVALVLTTALPSIAGGPPPKVNSADPPSAEQGTVGLDVRIKGSNFAPGSQVKFLVSGTNDEDEIFVNSVSFVDSTELLSNIDVEDAAIVGDYDIEVLSNGRRGKGREKFAVTEKGGGGPHFHLYDVTITGDVSGSGENWQEDSGNDRVVYQHFFPPTANGFLDLSYFRVPAEQGGPFTGARGANCFSAGLVPLYQVILGKSKGVGDPRAWFWFEGYTDDGLTPVLYHLGLPGGTFDHLDDWPPLAWNSMEMPSWKLGVVNVGKKLKNISCIGAGDFEVGFPIVIDVVRTQ